MSIDTLTVAGGPERQIAKPEMAGVLKTAKALDESGQTQQSPDIFEVNSQNLDSLNAIKKFIATVDPTLFIRVGYRKEVVACSCQAQVHFSLAKLSTEPLRTSIVCNSADDIAVQLEYPSDSNRYEEKTVFVNYRLHSPTDADSGSTFIVEVAQIPSHQGVKKIEEYALTSEAEASYFSLIEQLRNPVITNEQA